jgi:uncharacterized RDD family membrane protein YckC
MQNIDLITSQNVSIKMTPAGVVDRILAFFLDSLVILAYMFSVSLLFFIPINAFNLKYPEWIILVLFLPAMFYFLLVDIFRNGRSFGMSALNMQVMREDGMQPNLGNYFIRFLLLPIDTFFFGAVGILTMVFTAKTQRLGDLASGTIVVKNENMRNTLQRIKLAQVAVPEDYEPTYPIASNLTTHETTLIREALRLFKKDLDAGPALKLYEALKMKYNLDAKQMPMACLETLLKDQMYYANR